MRIRIHSPGDRALLRSYSITLCLFPLDRMDIPGYECFAGVEDERGRVVLAEAGSDCRRGLRVESLGMHLTKRSTCRSNQAH